MDSVDINTRLGRLEEASNEGKDQRAKIFEKLDALPDALRETENRVVSAVRDMLADHRERVHRSINSFQSGVSRDLLEYRSMDKMRGEEVASLRERHVALEARTTGVESKLNHVVIKPEFEPVKRVVYGCVALCLTAVVAAILYVVIPGAKPRVATATTSASKTVANANAQ